MVDDQEAQPQRDPLPKNRLYAEEVAQESNGVTIILTLLQNILKGSTLLRDSFLRSREIATLGVVLAKIDGRLIDVPVLMSIQKLIETLQHSNKVLMPCIFQYILFNFSIWSRCDFAIKIGHIQYLSTLIKEDPTYFRTRFGTEFILDVIRTYYVTDSAYCRDALAMVDEGGAKIFRGSLFGKARSLALTDLIICLKIQSTLKGVFSYYSFFRNDKLFSETEGDGSRCYLVDAICCLCLRWHRLKGDV